VFYRNAKLQVKMIPIANVLFIQEDLQAMLMFGFESTVYKPMIEQVLCGSSNTVQGPGYGHYSIFTLL
jgi:hypothetical protein